MVSIIPNNPPLKRRFVSENQCQLEIFTHDPYFTGCSQEEAAHNIFPEHNSWLTPFPVLSITTNPHQTSRSQAHHTPPSPASCN